MTKLLFMQNLKMARPYLICVLTKGDQEVLFLP